jgi:hypothetical protein
VFADEQLVAVLVQLDDAVHEDERGGWFLEVGFGPCSRSSQPVFGSLEEAQAWVQEQVRVYRVCVPHSIQHTNAHNRLLEAMKLLEGMLNRLSKAIALARGNNIDYLSGDGSLVPARRNLAHWPNGWPT